MNWGLLIFIFHPLVRVEFPQRREVREWEIKHEDKAQSIENRERAKQAKRKEKNKKHHIKNKWHCQQPFPRKGRRSR